MLRRDRHTVPLQGGTEAPGMADWLPAGATCGEYALEQLLGCGGFGAVYLARHRVLDRPAAIKILHPDQVGSAQAVERFVLEARVVNLIRHPNIVDVYEFGRLVDGTPYLVMELLQGSSLEDQLGHELPLSRSVAIALQIVDALEAAHEKGVVHRDLKPENVFLVPAPGGGDHVKLLDFGIAKLSDQEPRGMGLTRTGSIVGSPRYCSPEQAAGTSVSAASDVYSLGVVLYQMVVGRLPFDRPTAVEVLAAHIHDVPPAPRSLRPRIPASLERILLAMLAKAPGDRPSLAQIRDALRIAADRPVRTRPGWAVIAGAIAAIGATVVVTVMGPWREPAPATSVRATTTRREVARSGSTPEATPKMNAAAAAPIESATPIEPIRAPSAQPGRELQPAAREPEQRPRRATAKPKRRTRRSAEVPSAPVRPPAPAPEITAKPPAPAPTPGPPRPPPKTQTRTRRLDMDSPFESTP